ncbi:hypothetical protein [Streptomyces sp. NPDC008121]|uniref:hypothetical protein n=1 Tax=Streptomyces sp. NPDC008121 TaxID=3364809 RepID=UPI0036E6C0EE
MHLVIKTALATAICACLTAGTPATSAHALTAGRHAAGIAQAGGEPDKAGTACAFCVYNTVDVTNNTGEKLTLTSLDIESSHSGYHYSYDQAILQDGGLWLPRVGDTLEPGETRSYGVIFWSHYTPEVYTNFEDEKKRKTTFATYSWADGGSTVSMRMGQGLWPLGSNAAPGQHTKISIVATG